MTVTLGAQLDAGLLSPTAVADVFEARDDAGARRICVRIADGWSFDVLPDRGLDIGGAWLRGSPVSWRSPVPVDPGGARGWGDRFLGGLLVTCGPDVIGVDDDGSLHGRHSSTPAHEVRWHRERCGDEITVTVSGLVDDVRMFGRHVRVERRISASTGSDAVRVSDRIVNLGREHAAVALLYHVNLGAPAILPGATVQIDAASTAAREVTDSVPDHGLLPQPIDHTEETVFRHDGIPTADGWAHAVVTTDEGTETIVRWSGETLPLCHQWVLPVRGGWALGIEPSTAPLFGPGRAGSHRGAPVLAPGAELRTRVEIVHRRRIDA